MTADDVRIRADKIRKATSTRGSALWRGLRMELAIEVLRDIANNQARRDAHVLASEALKVVAE